MKLTDRLGLAVCHSRMTADGLCKHPCWPCREDGMAVGLAVAEWLEERHGYSETAQLLRGVCES